MLQLFSDRYAHASGALWLAGEKTVVVADAHLGYGWAQRRRGQLGPVSDGGAREALKNLVDELEPARIVFAGDVVHAPRPAEAERELVEATMRGLAEQAEVVCATGNHDRRFKEDFGHLPVKICSQCEVGDVTVLHGDRLPPLPEKGAVVFGHYHPAMGIEDAAGASKRFRLFLYSARLMVLPAFSPFAAGWDLRRGWPGELQEFVRGEEMEGVVTSGKRLAKIGRIPVR